MLPLLRDIRRPGIDEQIGSNISVANRSRAGRCGVHVTHSFAFACVAFELISTVEVGMRKASWNKGQMIVQRRARSDNTVRNVNAIVDEADELREGRQEIGVCAKSDEPIKSTAQAFRLIAAHRIEDELQFSLI